MSQYLLDDLLTSPIDLADRYSLSLDYDDPDLCLIKDGDLLEGETITPLGPQGKIGIPYLVHLGNTDLILKSSSKVYLSLTYSPSKPRKDQPCLPKTSNLSFLGADEFTNERLNAVVINSFFDQWNLETGNSFYPCIKYLSSSYCDQTREGLHLQEYADLGTLVDFATSDQTKKYRNPRGNRITLPALITILTQVISGLDLLQDQFDFNHGDLKAANVFVSSTPSTRNKVISDFICKIADYGKSSLTVSTDEGETRIYYRSALAETSLVVVPFRPLISKDETGTYFEVEKGFDFQVYLRTRHMGYPYYLAFDTYTFLISLLLIPAYYYPFFESEEMVNKLWIPLWKNPDQANQIEEEIMRGHTSKNPNSVSAALKILKGRTLRCDGTKILLSGINML